MRAAVALLCGSLAACAMPGDGDPAPGGAGQGAPAAGGGAAAALPEPSLPAPVPGGQVAPTRRPLERPPEQVAPDIYMALQQDSAGTVSVIFAIDRAKDNTPSDDPAIRLTPENGLCNPQQLRNFDFPAVYGARPVYSALDARENIGARELPSFLATAVTVEMVRLGMAREPDDTRPQNLCSFELWRRLVSAEFKDQLATRPAAPAPQTGQ
ncbi:hypothetical protein LNKW23_05000 [Paralimibaculum aggregatum]|uniref:Lipoprotein n=1 Tax=Paralimibaculum aggregatum TaxID=3036245 RepID=A0ABQ6LD57_9RHOB|nr:hypothetical protein [Limibaculum sp. NKW23]GMG81287.1 hypothetical protein LNKW23_05000 [Limibaculum sp. NKW23]